MAKHFDHYLIMTGSDTRHLTAQLDLQKNVLSMLEEGYIPLGGVVYMGTETTVHGFVCQIYCQAMGKPSESVDNKPVVE